MEWRNKHHHRHPSYPLQTSSKILSIPWFTHPSYSLQTSSKIISTFSCPRPHSRLPTHLQTSSMINSSLWCPHLYSPIQDLSKTFSAFWFLFRICLKLDLLYGFLVLPLLCSICRKSIWSIVSSSFLSSAGFIKNFSESWCPNTPFPILCLHICRILQMFALLHGVLILPLLYRLRQKNALHFGFLVLPLLCRLRQKYALHCGVLILHILWIPFQIILFILFLFHNHFWTCRILIGQWCREKMWWIIWRNMTITNFLYARSLCMQSEQVSKIMKEWKN